MDTEISASILSVHNKTVELFSSYSSFRYDVEAKYFDEGVRTERRKQLKDKMLQVMPLSSELLNL